MVQPFPGGITAPLDWINGILPMLPGASVDWIKHELVVKLRTFFQTSGAWRDWIGPITMDPDTEFYSPELTDYKAEMVGVLNGYRTSDNFPLLLVTDDDRAINQMVTGQEPSQPQYVYRTPEGLLAIFPRITPNLQEQVMLYVSMMPIDLCVPTWIKLRHYDAIRAGVLGAGYFTPGINYKPDLGARMERRFRAAMSRATQDAIYSGTAAPQRVDIPRQVVGSQRGRFATTAVSGTRW